MDGFQYSTPNTEPLRIALEKQDDATVSAARAGNEEAFSAMEERPIAPGNPPAATMVLSFFPTAEGFYDYENMRYIYQYKDHLGNVRVSFVKDGSSLKITDSNDYYPFGLSFLKPAGLDSYYYPMAIPYNYKYNGKELQETGMYDYGARFYMPDIGRWGVVDPLAETSRRWSTYTYAFNNPIRFIDPDGRQNEDWVKRTGMSNWEYRSDINSKQEATAAGFASYADGRGDANSRYSTTLGRSGADIGINQNVVLGEGGNYTVNGEAFRAPDHYTDTSGVDNFGKFMAGFVAFPMLLQASPLIFSGGTADVLATKAGISIGTQLLVGGDVNLVKASADTFLTPGAGMLVGNSSNLSAGNLVTGKGNAFSVSSGKDFLIGVGTDAAFLGRKSLLPINSLAPSAQKIAKPLFDTQGEILSQGISKGLQDKYK